MPATAGSTGAGPAAPTWEHAPVALLTTDACGTVLAANEALLSLIDARAADVVDGVRLADLLTAGGRIYWETHLAPLLALHGRVEEVAVELRGPRGPVPVLLTAVVRPGGGCVDVALAAATHRREYEQELLRARTAADAAARELADLHRHSAGVAHELQRALLATAVPADPRFTVSTEYRPAVQTLEVGGDWYDAFLLTPDRLVVVMGDVVGRGLAAATTMGQLRSALRAVSDPRISLMGILSALDRFVARTGVGFMTTLVVAELDLSCGALRWVSAGHLPGVLLPADRGARSARLLWEGQSLPLGLEHRDRTGQEGRAQLEPGDVLVLYTDGLVERRDRGLHHGLTLLQDTVQRTLAHGGAHAGDLADALTADPGDRDDVCVLLLEWSGPPTGPAPPSAQRRSVPLAAASRS